MKKSTSDHPAGFTITELALTLAILGILAAVAVPAIAHWRESFALRNASQEVFAMLMQAKSEAMRRNRACVAQFNTHHIAGQADMQICVRDCTQPANIIQQTIQLPDGVSFGDGHGANANCLPILPPLPPPAGGVAGAAIVFQPNALPVPGQLGSVVLTIGQLQACVQISRTGNITIF